MGGLLREYQPHRARETMRPGREFYYVKVKLMVDVRVVQVSGFDGNGIFSAKIRIYKSFISVFKKFWAKKIPKNFDQSESWKIKFHFRYQNYILFESACSTEFKTGLGFKIGYVVLEKFRVKNRKFRKNDDFLRKNFSQAQISLCHFLTIFFYWFWPNSTKKNKKKRHFFSENIWYLVLIYNWNKYF